MSGLALVRVDTHRMDLRYDDRLLAFAVWDLYGWSLLQRRNALLRQVDRVEDTPSLSTLRYRAEGRLLALGSAFPSATTGAPSPGPGTAHAAPPRSAERH
jgi:hypothetical protein